MFDRVLIEKDVLDNSFAQNIISNIKYKELIEIDNYDDYFGKYKKKYLLKQKNINLFIARKKGQLIKETPPAYGLDGEKHFYYIHQYNCIYECDYCYLQGYFHSPDIVMFVNHDEIINEMQKKMDEDNTNQRIWFHAGEFSDSLALSNITNEFSLYYDFLIKNPNSLIELRTKSVNTKALLGPMNNLFLTYSLSPSEKIKKHDIKTPGLKHRLLKIKELYSEGYKIGIHLDPIIYEENFEDIYQTFLAQLNEAIPIQKIEYISIGVVRFTPDVYREVKNNYPDSEIHQQELVKADNNLVRYNKPMRMWILNKVKEIILRYNIDEEKVYLCMED